MLHARILEIEEEIISSPFATKIANAGDFIVTGIKGEQYIFTDEEFWAGFTVIEVINGLECIVVAKQTEKFIDA